MTTVTFLAVNGIELSVAPDEGLEFMLEVAAGAASVEHAARWINERMTPLSEYTTATRARCRAERYEPMALCRSCCSPERERIVSL